MDERRTDDAKLIEAGIILARTYTRDELAQSMLTRLAQRLAELVEERRWVPVGERLPEEGLEVLAWHWKLGIETVCRVHGKWILQKYGHHVPDSSYTHWQPLPPGPEGA